MIISPSRDFLVMAIDWLYYFIGQMVMNLMISSPKKLVPDELNF